MAYIQGSAATGQELRVSRFIGGRGRTEFQAGQRPTPQSSRGVPPRNLLVNGLPLQKPPYGKISAIDLKEGTIAWQVAHGETPDRVVNHPALAGMDIPRTGQGASVGTLVTRSLLIAGEAQLTTGADGERRAFCGLMISQPEMRSVL